MVKNEKILGILRRAAVVGCVLSLLGLLLLLVGGPGYRFEWWDFKFGLALVKWSAFLSMPGILASSMGLVAGFSKGNARYLRPAVCGLLVGVAILTFTLRLANVAKTVPRIHDITTDTENPPTFTAVVPLRAKAMNPLEYGGKEIAVQQQKAYPDIRPKTLSLTPREAFDRTLQVAKAMGWEIVVADRNDMRIEATDTTAWFGFKDDVVVRLRPSSEGTRVDVRSISRVGISDLGANAKRIRSYLGKLD